MKYSFHNLEDLFQAMSIHVPENVVEQVEKAISKLTFGTRSFSDLEEAYDFFIDNIDNDFVLKSFVSAGILKIDPITPLFHAMISDEIDSAKYLISKGANLEGAVILLKNELSNSEIRDIIKKINS
jgi:hypothetical protein